ncbi:unnamed protein product [Trichobilharzia regenti]|nr:unnamed protein product [Trichobilharzia regenti]
MASFDVSSLFTNVDYICEQIIERKLYTGVPTGNLKQLLVKCTTNVQFLFNNEMYRRVDGVTMGSPLGPIFANIFLTKLENSPLKDEIAKMEMYCRYMDDTFVVYDEGFK